MTEIVKCPSCSRQLQVPEDFFGKTVQCPECKQTFKAVASDTAPNAPPAAPPPAVGSVPAWDRPPRRSSEPDEDDEDRPRERRFADDYEDDKDHRPGVRRSRYLSPHRGGMILAFGIMAIVGVVPIIFGPMAWLMGNGDLREMRSGRMDPSGEGQTNTGRILGMIATLLIVIITLLACVFVAFIVLIGITAGPAGRR